MTLKPVWGWLPILAGGLLIAAMPASAADPVRGVTDT